METLPLTASGKINRKTLMEMPLLPVTASPSPVTPCSATERILIDMWKEILGQPEIDVHDNFFELGGHSLLATKVVTRINNLGYPKITLKDLFESPTVAGFARKMESQEGN